MEDPVQCIDAPRNMQMQWEQIGQSWTRKEDSPKRKREGEPPKDLADWREQEYDEAIGQFVPQGQVRFEEPMPALDEMRYDLQEAIAGFKQRKCRRFETTKNQNRFKPEMPSAYYSYESRRAEGQQGEASRLHLAVTSTTEDKTLKTAQEWLAAFKDCQNCRDGSRSTGLYCPQCNVKYDVPEEIMWIGDEEDAPDWGDHFEAGYEPKGKNSR